MGATSLALRRPDGPVAEGPTIVGRFRDHRAGRHRRPRAGQCARAAPRALLDAGGSRERHARGIWGTLPASRVPAGRPAASGATARPTT